MKFKEVTKIFVLMGIILAIIFSIATGLRSAYDRGVQDTHREAFENGLMLPEINTEGEIFYRWVELHKLQEIDPELPNIE